jgi:hypothetical protein
MLAGTVVSQGPAWETVRGKEQVGFAQNSELSPLCLHKDRTQTACAVRSRLCHVTEQKRPSNRYAA